MAESRTSSGSNARGRAMTATIHERSFKNKPRPRSADGGWMRSWLDAVGCMSAPADAHAGLPQLEETGVAGEDDLRPGGIAPIPQEQVQAGRRAGHGGRRARGVRAVLLPAGLETAGLGTHVPG